MESRSAVTNMTNTQAALKSAKVATTPVKLAFESDVTAGDLSANDAYDLTLWRMPNGDLELEIFMKLQFFFESGSGGDWTAAERTSFMSDWKTAIQTAWGQRSLKRLKNGRHVHLRTAFSIQEGGWMMDHWEITVTKIKQGTFRTSYVQPATGNVTLDSEDLSLVDKGAGFQRGAVHEFGHMLGLKDEYKAGSAHAADSGSLMHSAEGQRQRHVSGPLAWLNAKLKKLGLE